MTGVIVTDKDGNHKKHGLCLMSGKLSSKHAAKGVE